MSFTIRHGFVFSPIDDVNFVFERLVHIQPVGFDAGFPFFASSLFSVPFGSSDSVVDPPSAFEAFLRQAFNPQNQTGHGHAASQEAIRKLRKGRIKNAGTACAVCQNDFEVGQEFLELPCHHIFHDDCILPWFKERNSCPTCRYEIETDDEAYNVSKVRRQPPPPPLKENGSDSDDIENYKKAVIDFAQKLMQAECALSVIRGEPCVLRESEEMQEKESEEHVEDSLVEAKVEPSTNAMEVEEDQSNLSFEPVVSTPYSVNSAAMPFNDRKFTVNTPAVTKKHKTNASKSNPAAFSTDAVQHPTCTLMCKHKFHTECLYEFQRLNRVASARVVVGNGTLVGDDYLVCPVCKVVTLVDPKDLELHRSQMVIVDEDVPAATLNIAVAKPLTGLVRAKSNNSIATPFAASLDLFGDLWEEKKLQPESEVSEDSVGSPQAERPARLCEQSKDATPCNSDSELLKLKCSHIFHEDCLLKYQRDLSVIKKGKTFPVLVCPKCRTSNPNNWDLIN